MLNLLYVTWTGIDQSDIFRQWTLLVVVDKVVVVVLKLHDVTAAILVFQNNETEAMLMYQDNPVGNYFLK